MGCPNSFSIFERHVLNLTDQTVTDQFETLKRNCGLSGLCAPQHGTLFHLEIAQGWGPGGLGGSDPTVWWGWGLVGIHRRGQFPLSSLRRDEGYLLNPE